MQNPEQISNFIDALSYPLLLLKKEGVSWSIQYQNESMQNLLAHDSQDNKLSEPLKKLITQYQSHASGKSTNTLYHYEIFDNLYNISFEETQDNIFAFFIEVPLQNLFDCLPFHNLHGIYDSLIVVLNPKGEVVETNECFSNLVGMQKSKIEGKDFFENFIPGNRETLTHYLEHVYAHENHQEHFITPLKGVDKNTHRINWNVSKVHWHEETYVIAVGSDISKFTEENTHLKKKLHSIQVGFDYFPFGIAYMNAKGKFTNMNPRFMKMFKLKEDDNLYFDDIKLFQKNIGFKSMQEYIRIIKEMSYKVKHKTKYKSFTIKIDVRLLSGKKNASKLYIIVVQQIKD